MSEVPEPELEAFANAPVDALDVREAKLEASDDEIEAGIKRAQLTRANQDNTHRDKFVTWVIRIVSGTLVSSVAIMGLYVGSEWHEIEPEVLIAWFSATVVQTLGLAYVIAKHLFPENR